MDIGLQLVECKILKWSNSGHARIYELNNNSWEQIGSDIDGSLGDHLGFSVSISGDGNLVAIGSPNDDSNGNDVGHSIKIYEWYNWVQYGSKIYDIMGENAGDRKMVLIH